MIYFREVCMVFLRQINSCRKESRKFVSFQPEKTLFRQYCLPGNNFKLINFVVECFFCNRTKRPKNCLKYYNTFLLKCINISDTVLWVVRRKLREFIGVFVIQIFGIKPTFTGILHLISICSLFIISLHGASLITKSSQFYFVTK
ncbi:hypothetical protein BANRA_05238 [Escherichia coli]|uniref:Uncharacterized protein n=1 Tax=Escherichia coli TaxID=562 RepID=A0A3P5DWS4_ECOLX|nr:hypothetical protein BANRA_05238 [Escherichia coli]